MAPGYRAIFDELRERGVYPLEFDSVPLVLWTCVELRKLIRLFDPQAQFPTPQLKIDLCAQLVRVKPGELTRNEASAVRAIYAGRTLDHARVLLRHAPPPRIARPATVPAVFRKRPASPPPVAISTGHKTLRVSNNRVLSQSELRQILTNEAQAPTNHLPARSSNLEAVVKPEETRQCQICSEPRPLSDFQELTADARCEHKTKNTCNQCLMSHIQAQMDSVRLDSIRCPESDCDETLSYLQMQSYASPQTFARYDSFITRKALEQIPEYYECCNQNCESGGFRELASTEFIECSDCNTRTCVTCDTVWHHGISHEENLRNIGRVSAATTSDDHATDVEEASTEALRILTKRCPASGCGVRIQKSGGCDHMTCTQCGYEFCWECFADYTPINQRGDQYHLASCSHYTDAPPRMSFPIAPGRRGYRRR